MSGLMSLEEIREHFPWVWYAHGDRSTTPKALELLEATGYITDSPNVELPLVIRVYQGRLADEELGVAWTPDPQRAHSYAQTYRGLRGVQHEPVIWAGRARREHVLFMSRFSQEVLVRPQDVTELQMRRRPGVGGAPGWIRVTDGEIEELTRSAWMPAVRLFAPGKSPEVQEGIYEGLVAEYRASIHGFA